MSVNVICAHSYEPRLGWLLENLHNDTLAAHIDNTKCKHEARRRHRKDQSHAVDRNLCLTEHLIKVTSLRQGRRIINVRDWCQQRA